MSVVAKPPPSSSSFRNKRHAPEDEYSRPDPLQREKLGDDVFVIPKADIEGASRVVDPSRPADSVIVDMGSEFQTVLNLKALRKEDHAMAVQTAGRGGPAIDYLVELASRPPPSPVVKPSPQSAAMPSALRRPTRKLVPETPAAISVDDLVAAALARLGVVRPAVQEASASPYPVQMPGDFQLPPNAGPVPAPAPAPPPNVPVVFEFPASGRFETHYHSASYNDDPKFVVLTYNDAYVGSRYWPPQSVGGAPIKLTANGRTALVHNPGIKFTDRGCTYLILIQVD